MCGIIPLAVLTSASVIFPSLTTGGCLNHLKCRRFEANGWTQAFHFLDTSWHIWKLLLSNCKKIASASCGMWPNASTGQFVQAILITEHSFLTYEYFNFTCTWHRWHRPWNSLTISYVNSGYLSLTPFLSVTGNSWSYVMKSQSSRGPAVCAVNKVPLFEKRSSRTLLCARACESLVRRALKCVSHHAWRPLYASLYPICSQ